ncbi:coiled-coil domain-containing protein 148-like [Brienomyrus brachyistius]|uniref:coiled-coil domain-containing protein 148-like n=1 Tax=Brienomyrus brachyistius TaxID=42636 RepID=UPI0020B36A25|nr:coiled-coil domain-containing protein 148-like [Brienomyrus brachyistius]XP_048883239.1 coiled-coil domain-containing protein 148-like [Brienomyrus brachyistius]XP_048883244.1 coiled-coil domain-containing protein 148-like [Brienomyrus brachyistius]XP_048883255.1 coiled-coil domain-containing protein 148-like [Brienomyrus brachyistius]XP_048883265.1 coiled-coil domain-containing protein 148-like [Brienomyrus brachyistius]XP_048883274.1 coiled-coil domain-containing protein 148-like [Brienom
MNAGMGSGKYKPVCYETLQTLVEAKKRDSAQLEEKILRTRQAAQRSKENTLLRQHRQAWSREHGRLARARGKAESELQEFLGQGGADVEFLSQFLDYDVLLERERAVFETATVKPIWQLRDDLRFRLAEEGRGPSQPCELDLILQQVQSVKEQQAEIEKKLRTEYLRLEREMSAMQIEECLSPIQEDPGDMGQVPAEILHSECPYPDLKASLIREFQGLSEKYRSRLESIKLNLQDLDRCCGWTPEDHLAFEVTMSQYPPSVSMHRILYMDMLQRLLPHKARQELQEHERCWDQYHYTLEQRQTLIHSWRRDRAALLDEALSTLQEARLAHLRELAERGDREQQQATCAHLRQKLLQWRLQQEEAGRLEEAEAARRREEKQERLRREQEQEDKRRTFEKERIRGYRFEKHRRREELREIAEQRLAALRTLMTERARRDMERVQFREEILQRRREEKEGQLLMRLREQEEKQERLESLRKEVAVFVEADPERMMKDTQASKNRYQGGAEEFVLHKPLYHLHTYTDAQVTSDPRLRIECALREAGLHSALYAQEVLSGIRPKRPPRRDTQSTGFRF